MTDVRQIEFNDRMLRFVIANQNARWRFDTFYSKEPETLKWIAKFSVDELFVDIGANIGVYTIAASVGAGCRVLAFEPEAENFALLNQNIRANRVSSLVDAFPLALSNKTGLGRLNVSKPEAGQSGHQLNHFVAGPGSVRTQGCVYATLRESIGSTRVHHIKIDVDGQEPRVLDGIGLDMLCAAKSILLEVNLNDPEHRHMLEVLKYCEFESDPEQVERSRRKSGPFIGYAEHIFYRKRECNRN